MKKRRQSRKKAVAHAVAGTVAGTLASSALAEKMNAWSAPQWGFVQAIKEEVPAPPKPPATLAAGAALANSLVFDQAFDKVAYRPWPVLNRRAVVRSSAPAAGSVVRTVASVAPVKTIETLPLAAAPRVSEEVFAKTAALQADIRLTSLRQNRLIASLESYSGQSIAKPSLEMLPMPVAVGAGDSSWNQLQADALQRKLEHANDVVRSDGKAEYAIFDNLLPSAKPSPKDPSPPAPAREKGTEIARNDRAVRKAGDDAIETTDKGDLRLGKLQIPKADRAVGTLYLVDEESLQFGDAMGVENALVTWVGNASNLGTKSKKGGVAKAPYHSAKSMRFVVQAPGYLPAVGYASAGIVTPVALYKESRLGPVIKSLGVVPDPSKVLVFGKVLDAAGKPQANVTIDASIEAPFRVAYAMGSFGLFHPKALMTGSSGDFFVTGVNSGLQYFMPTQSLSRKNNYDAAALDDAKAVEWPASILNLTGVGPAVTVTLQQGELRKLKTQIVDAFAMERPSDVGIQVTVGGQRGLFVPDADGNVTLPEMYRRSTPDLVEVRAQGYMRTWVTGSAEPGGFPDSIAIFTQRHVDTLLAEVLPEIQLTRGVVFGNLRAETFAKSVKVQVYDAGGSPAADAKILYFDDKNLARQRLDRTDPVVQNFAVANLNPGEWQVVATDAATGKVVGAQVVRVDMDTVSQLQF